MYVQVQRSQTDITDKCKLRYVLQAIIYRSSRKPSVMLMHACMWYIYMQFLKRILNYMYIGYVAGNYGVPSVSKILANGIFVYLLQIYKCDSF